MALMPGALDGETFAPFTPDYWSLTPVVQVPTGHSDPDRAEDLWHFNPRVLVRDCDHLMVRLWFQSGGREGLRHLPQAGGLLDQAAVMLEAFEIIALAVSVYATGGDTE